MKSEDIRLGQRIFFSDAVDEIKNTVVTRLESINDGDICVTISDGKKEGVFTAHMDDEIGIRIFDVTGSWYRPGECCVSFQPLKEWMLAALRENKEEMIKKADEYIARLEALKEEDL